MSTVEPNPPNESRKPAPKASNVYKEGKEALQFLIPTAFGIFVCFLLYQFVQQGSAGQFDDIARNHPAAMLGLPLCAIGALCLVLLLRSTSGPIEFEAAGFKFKGASGPIIMWIATFLAMAVALRLLWNP